MTPAELAEVALRLAGEASLKLERWLAVLERGLAEAEEGTRPPDLKELAAFLACVKRTLEIARIAGILQPGEGGSHGTGVDPESLRRLLFEED
jgi:hypothetical protein